MLVKILMLIVAFMPLTTSVEAGLWENVKILLGQQPEKDPPMIQVLIVHDQPGVILEVKGKYRLYDPRTMEHISTRYTGKRKFMQGLKGGLRWGEEFPGLHQLLVVPDTPSVTTLVDGIEYRGTIFVYDIGGSISVVNQIDIEDFLQSSLAKQFTEPFDEETLAAIAIAARTNAYYLARNPQSPFWAVDGKACGYQGNAIANRNSPIERAIKGTRFLIMSHVGGQKGQPNPFPSQWGPNSSLSVAQADQLAKKGENAAQILRKAFPDSYIMLMHQIAIN